MPVTSVYIEEVARLVRWHGMLRRAGWAGPAKGAEGRMAVSAGVGLTAMPGGNLLGGKFLDTDNTGMTVRFTVPPVPGLSLDFGDGTAAVVTTTAGYIDHTYAGAGPHPWVFTASLIDPADNRWRGWRRFEVPCGPYGPWSLPARGF